MVVDCPTVIHGPGSLDFSDDIPLSDTIKDNIM